MGGAFCKILFGEDGEVSGIFERDVACPGGELGEVVLEVEPALHAVDRSGEDEEGQGAEAAVADLAHGGVPLVGFVEARAEVARGGEEFFGGEFVKGGQAFAGFVGDAEIANDALGAGRGELGRGAQIPEEAAKGPFDLGAAFELVGMDGVDEGEAGDVFGPHRLIGASENSAQGVASENKGAREVRGVEKAVEVGGDVFGVARFLGGIAPAEASAIVGEDFGGFGKFVLDPMPAGGHRGEAGFENDGRLRGGFARNDRVQAPAANVVERAGRGDFWGRFRNGAQLEGGGVFSRPFGTKRVVDRCPGIKMPGYFQKSLRDKE